MHTDRLLTLAKFLREKVPAEQFNMEAWCEAGDDTDVKAVGDCGTAGCALGWAMAVPAFKELGLRAGFRHSIGTIYLSTVDGDGTAVTYHDLQAGQELFDLSRAQAKFLFMPNSYPWQRGPVRPEDVAGRIERLVQANGDPRSALIEFAIKRRLPRRGVGVTSRSPRPPFSFLGPFLHDCGVPAGQPTRDSGAELV